MTNIREIILIILLCSLLVIFNSYLKDIDRNRLVIEDTKNIEVKKGDTLWKIAAEINDNSYNNHRLISVIKEMNRLDTVMIRPGQTLEIPVIEEKNNKKLEAKR